MWSDFCWLRKWFYPACILAFMFIIISINFCWADVYKYVDESGVMHLTNCPSNPATKYVMVMKAKSVEFPDGQGCTQETKKEQLKDAEKKIVVEKIPEKKLTKLEEIQKTKDSLSKKLEESKSAREEFGQKINILIEEIKEINQEKQADSYEKAIKNSKVKQNMRLIQKLAAYIEKTIELEATLRAGINELIYVERDIQVETKAMVLFNNAELVKKIDAALEKYSPYKNDFAIDEKSLKLRPLEQIYAELVVKSEKKEETFVEIDKKSEAWIVSISMIMLAALCYGVLVWIFWLFGFWGNCWAVPKKGKNKTQEKK